MKIKELCRKYEPYVIELRREFHRHPEPSLHEERTSQRIKEELTRLGIPWVGVSGYNVVASIGQGTNGKSIAVRADMDALRMTEKSGLPFASENEGVMHACGHDAHIAMLLGVAAVLKELESEIKGTVKLCFQSAEEVNQGAVEIVQYLKEQGGVDQAIGLHIWSTLQEGRIALLPERCMAGSVGWTVDLVGEGGHSSRPDLVRDPIKAACDLVLKFSEIPGNFYDILDPCVVTTGLMRAGTMDNVFPSEASIEGGCRYFNLDGANDLIKQLERMVKGVSLTYNVEGKLNILGYMYPVINTPELVEKARKLVPQVEGLETDDDFGVLLSSENFSEFLREFPGFFAILGGGNPEKGICYGQHHEKFNVDEKAFRKGFEFMVRYAFSVI